MQNIFIFGTLLSPGILEKLTGKSWKTSSAVLFGYKRYCVKNRDYPAIIKQEDSKTVGLFIENMDDLSLAVVSFYEGDEYEKEKVTVTLNEKSVPALTFVWVNGNECLENREWDLQYFEKTSLENYLDVVIPETLEAFYKK
jgi:gamma-glutamylcyclotransferase (GGCT)/AIG2-like uncharacterized protein YtfP